MEESKIQDLHDMMNYLFDDEEKKLKEKKNRELQLKREEESRKRNIIVKSVSDLKEKYEDYDIQVDSYTKIITLNKPLEVKYIDQFRYECNRLGFKFEIHNISIEDLYSNYRI